MTLFPSGAIEIDELIASDKGTYWCNVTSGTFYTYVDFFLLETRLSKLFVRINKKNVFFSSFFVELHRHSSKTSLNIKAGGEPQQFQQPTFLTESISKTANEGDMVFLDCVANGNPRPQIKWLRNGEDIDINGSDSRFKIIGTGSLQITSASELDEGNYQCRASNSMDSADIELSLMVIY